MGLFGFGACGMSCLQLGAWHHVQAVGESVYCYMHADAAVDTAAIGAVVGLLSLNGLFLV
jgi:hypothetical protein